MGSTLHRVDIAVGAAFSSFCCDIDAWAGTWVRQNIFGGQSLNFWMKRCCLQCKLFQFVHNMLFRRVFLDAFKIFSGKDGPKLVHMPVCCGVLFQRWCMELTRYVWCKIADVISVALCRISLAGIRLYDISSSHDFTKHILFLPLVR